MFRRSGSSVDGQVVGACKHEFDCTGHLNRTCLKCESYGIPAGTSLIREFRPILVRSGKFYYGDRDSIVLMW